MHRSSPHHCRRKRQSLAGLDCRRILRLTCIAAVVSWMGTRSGQSVAPSSVFAYGNEASRKHLSRPCASCLYLWQTPLYLASRENLLLPGSTLGLQNFGQLSITSSAYGSHHTKRGRISINSLTALRAGAIASTPSSNQTLYGFPSPWSKIQANATMEESEKQNNSTFDALQARGAYKLKRLAVKSRSSRRFQKHIDRLYRQFDTNQDGTISIDEAYVLVLKLYIELNRQAPLEPPSRTVLEQICFQQLDTDDDSVKLSKTEFTDVCNLLYQQAAMRLTTQLIIKFIIAPFLAQKTFYYLAGREVFVDQLKGITKAILSAFIMFLTPFSLEGPTSVKIQDVVLHRILSPVFCQTALILIYISTLGDAVLQAVHRWSSLRELVRRREEEQARDSSASSATSDQDKPNLIGVGWVSAFLKAEKLKKLRQLALALLGMG